MHHRIRSVSWFLLTWLVAAHLARWGTCQEPLSLLADAMRPAWGCLAGETERFDITGHVEALIKNKPQVLSFRLVRNGEQEFLLSLAHVEHSAAAEQAASSDSVRNALNFGDAPQHALVLHRNGQCTRLFLPTHGVVFVGEGDVDADDHLAPCGALSRLISADSLAGPLLPTLAHSDPKLVAMVLTQLAKLRFDDESQFWRLADGSKGKFRFAEGGQRCEFEIGSVSGTVSILGADQVAADPTELVNGLMDTHADWRQERLERSEIETRLARGVRRATEILAPGLALTSPARLGRTAEHGQLQWEQHQRVVTLRGSSEQVGTSHAELLRAEATRCIDSVLNTFGTVQTIRSGRWFRRDLEEAYARLAPHIPASHTQELHAMADALGYDRRLLETLNVFPELFHCSGFACYGAATVDGKLYHGRVLDYMTVIGLQDAATTFIIEVEGKIPFVSVGYAGFLGSVSGMNAQAISLGEMGGAGEGEWDGVPMATLMRRALEECHSLDEVIELWRNAPRTCEYYYVFADGKTRQAVGVAATPENFELVWPGESHPRLGAGIPDAVVLSAGSRLETLRQRIQERYGNIDAAASQWLMSRPVAMQSNLHNVLFVPEDGVLYVANATHRLPAAETPYLKLAWQEFLDAQREKQSVPVTTAEVDLPFGVLPVYTAEDTLHTSDEKCEDAQKCLAGLAWEPAKFDVRCEPGTGVAADLLVRFPSPVYSGDAINDCVTLEWYLAKTRGKEPHTAPAVVVIHESGRSMPVGRMFARGLNVYGLHTFLLHLPKYGDRRGGSATDLTQAVTLIRKAIVDARRARDVVAALPYVNTDHIALQGTSLGGFVASTAAGLDGKYDSVFLVLSGGDLFSLVQTGNHDTRRIRLQLERSGVSMELVKEIAEMVEPTRLAHRLPANRTWLFSGKFDDVVPLANGLALARAAGLDEAHHIQLPADHYSGMMFLPAVITQIHREITSAATSSGSVSK